MTYATRKYVSTTGKLSLLTLALLATPFAMAESLGWYGGANIGQSNATIDDDRITSDLLSRGLVAGSINDDDQDLGYKLFAGYQFNRYLSVEGGYFDLGQFGFSTTTTPQGTLNGDIRLRGLNLDAVGTLPITDKFSAFACVGVAYAQAKDTFSGSGAVRVLDPDPSAEEANVKFGLGLQYAFTEALSVRAEIERYRVDDAIGNTGDVDMASIGLVYRFGGTTTPTPVAYQAVPEPVVIAQAVPPAPRKITLSADSLFDFDSAKIKSAGCADLDKLVVDLRNVDFDVINITGHTDRIGRQAYNQKLSTQRAEAVGNYLVKSAGIPAHKISTKGVNGSDPVTKPGDCVGQKATPALIACLQPDRRVDIEVTGKQR